MRSLLAAVGLLLFCLLPAWGQEPSYTVTFAGNQRLHIGVMVTDEPNGRMIRLANRATGGEPDSYFLNMTLRLDADGLPLSAFSRFQVKATPHTPVLLEANRGMPDTYGYTTYDLRTPALSDTLPFSGKLVTETTLLLFVGRLYDWKIGGTQSFSYLLDYAATVPTVHTLKLTGNGTEEIALKDKTVKARRLTFETALPTLPTTSRTGTLYVGPSGDLLRLDVPLVLMPFKMTAPATWDDYTRTLELNLDLPGQTPSAVAIRAKFGADGQAKGIIALNKDYEIASAQTDARFNPTHIETLLLGRKMTADVNGSTVRYSLDAGDSTNVSVGEGKPLFFPQWFLSDTWEDGLKVGEKRDGSYFLLQNGFPGAFRFTMERQDDTVSALRGESVTVHRYRFTFWTDDKKTKPANYYDAYTDGKRLIALLGATDGVRIFRDGWEGYTASLKPPDAPK